MISCSLIDVSPSFLKIPPPLQEAVCTIVFEVQLTVSFALRFLYSELLRHYDGADDSIFEPAEDGKLKIKPDITFHLYIRWRIRRALSLSSPSSQDLLGYSGVSCAKLTRCNF